MPTLAIVLALFAQTYTVERGFSVAPGFNVVKADRAPQVAPAPRPTETHGDPRTAVVPSVDKSHGGPSGTVRALETDTPVRDGRGERVKAQCLCAGPGSDCGCDACRCEITAKKVSAERPTPKAESAPPALYILADAAGQNWTHADPAYLAQFVASRNASLYRPRTEAPAPLTVGGYAGAVYTQPCGPGRCGQQGTTFTRRPGFFLFRGR